MGKSTLTENKQASENSTSGKTPQNYDALVRQVADAVWKLWQEELKQISERRGTRRGR